MSAASRLIERARAAGVLSAEARAASIAAALDAIHGVHAAQEGSEVRVSGRGLLRRRLSDPRLLWPGRLG